MGVVTKIRKNRRHERIKVDLACSLNIGGGHHTGVTGNVSLSGVYLQFLIPPLPEGRIAELGELKLQLGAASISTPCRIVFIGGKNTPDLEGILTIQVIGKNQNIEKEIDVQRDDRKD